MKRVNRINSLITPIKIKEIVNHKNNQNIDISIVMPVYNQAEKIHTVISKIFENMQSNYELVVIDDGSRDKTLHKLLKIEPSFLRYPNLKSVTIYRNRFSRFETFCDTFGIDNSNGEYLLEIQADMFINDPGFDLRLIEAFKVDKNLVAVSGRGVENLDSIIKDYAGVLGTDRVRTTSFTRYFMNRINYQVKRFIKRLIRFEESRNAGPESFVSADNFVEKSDIEFLVSGHAGRLGQLIELEVTPKSISRKLYFGQTIMRGPILFDREKYFKVGGLDSSRFFQGFDDHDFCARALLLGYKVAYTAVLYDSPLEMGTTRRSRTLLSEFLIAFYTWRIRKLRYSSSLNGSDIKNLILTQNLSEIRTF